MCRFGPWRRHINLPSGLQFLFPTYAVPRCSSNRQSLVTYEKWSARIQTGLILTYAGPSGREYVTKLLSESDAAFHTKLKRLIQNSMCSCEGVKARINILSSLSLLSSLNFTPEINSFKMDVYKLYEKEVGSLKITSEGLMTFPAL